MVTHRFFSGLMHILCLRLDAKVWLLVHISHDRSNATCFPYIYVTAYCLIPTKAEL